VKGYRAGWCATGSVYRCIGIFLHQTLKEDEAILICILQTLTMNVDSGGMVLTEEVFSQCLSICLVLISCGVSTGSAADGGDGGGGGGGDGSIKLPGKLNDNSSDGEELGWEYWGRRRINRISLESKMSRYGNFTTIDCYCI